MQTTDLGNERSVECILPCSNEVSLIEVIHSLKENGTYDRWSEKLNIWKKKIRPENTALLFLCFYKSVFDGFQNEIEKKPRNKVQH